MTELKINIGDYIYLIYKAYCFNDREIILSLTLLELGLQEGFTFVAG